MIEAIIWLSMYYFYLPCSFLLWRKATKQTVTSTCCSSMRDTNVSGSTFRPWTSFFFPYLHLFLLCWYSSLRSSLSVGISICTLSTNKYSLYSMIAVQACHHFLSVCFLARSVARLYYHFWEKHILSGPCVSERMHVYGCVCVRWYRNACQMALKDRR